MHWLLLYTWTSKLTGAHGAELFPRLTLEMLVRANAACVQRADRVLQMLMVLQSLAPEIEAGWPIVPASARFPFTAY